MDGSLRVNLLQTGKKEIQSPSLIEMLMGETGD